MEKKIVFCVSNDLNNDQRMIRICSSLSAEGYKVALVGRLLPRSLSVSEKNYEQIRLPCFFTRGKIFYLEFNLKLFFFLMRRKTDAICAVDLDTILPVFLASKFRNKICIYDAHEYFTEVPEVVRRPLVKKLWEALASAVVPKIKHCYTVGFSLANEMTRRYNVEFEVIRNVSGRKKANVGTSIPDVKQPFLLYQGAVNEGRGLHLAIEAMRYIEGYTLVLAGEGDLLKELQTLCKDMGLDDKVQFLGKISPEQLSVLTPRAALGIHLLENKGLSYYYSLANRTFDYLEAGIPALHPDFPEYRILIKNYAVGALLKSYDPEQIAAQIVKMLSDRKYYDFMKSECERAFVEFCWENEEQKLIELYRQFFSGKGH